MQLKIIRKTSYPPLKKRECYLQKALATFLLGTSVCLVPMVTSAATPEPQAKTNNTLPSGYTQAYIGLFVTETVGDAFYPVIMNQKEQPYLAINNVLSRWLQLQVTDNQTSITAVLQATDKTYQFNKLTETLTTPDGKTIHLPKDALVFEGNQYWLRYDYWQQWLPLSSIWNLQQYELYLQPSFELYSQLQIDRKNNLLEQEAERKEQAKLDKLPAIKPQAPFDAEGRGRLDWSSPTAKDQSLSAQYAGNVDVMGGTLSASGQSIMTRNGTTTPPGYWSYTLLDKGGIHKIQVGDFFNQQTLLAPALNLQNGINIAKLEDKNLANGFTYTGHTLPNTEIDVWHNGILTTILTSDSGGNFTYRDPNGVPGDRYTFRFFFRDGTQANKVIQLSTNNQNLLEPPGSWNVILQNGYLNNDQFNVDTGLTTGNITHTAVWYGATQDISLGAEAYHLPLTTNDTVGGVDAAWQTLPTWSNLVETLSYQKHNDAAWQSSYTGFDRNTVQFEVKQQPLDSPMNQLAYPLPFTPLSLIPQILPSAQHMWSAKDIYNADSWQGTTEYRRTDVGDTANAGMTKSLTEHLSMSGLLGVIRPDFQATESYKQLTGMYAFNNNSILSVTRNFVPNYSADIVSYSRFSTGSTGVDYTAGYDKQENQQWDAFSNVTWRFSPNASTGLTAQRHQIYLTLSVYGMLAQGIGSTDYNNFATGTVYGYVFAPTPASGKPEPVQNAVIEVGGLTTKTDKNGYYFVSGLMTNERLTYRVNPNSLDADLIPDQDAQIVSLRPGTEIELDPKIDMTAGLDGQLEHSQVIPKGAQVVVVDHPGGDVIQSADIEANGFFIISKLKQQRYYLEFRGLLSPPKAQAINLHNVPGNWLSDVEVTWNPTHNPRKRS